MGGSKWPSTLAVLAGVWLIISPFVLGYNWIVAAVWTTSLVGILVAVLAWSRVAASAGPLASWMHLLLGIWLIISPFVFRFSDVSPASTNHVVMGVIIGVLGVWSVVVLPGRGADWRTTFSSALPTEKERRRRR